VPTQSNPADIDSCAGTESEQDSSIWLTGPPFLYEGISKWPVAKSAAIDLGIVNCEKRKHIFSTITTNNYLLASLEKHSSYTVCLRIVSWMFRFIHVVRKSSKGWTLTLSPELEHIANCITWNLQNHSFSEEPQVLKGPLKFLS